MEINKTKYARANIIYGDDHARSDEKSKYFDLFAPKLLIEIINGFPACNGMLMEFHGTNLRFLNSLMITKSTSCFLLKHTLQTKTISKSLGTSSTVQVIPTEKHMTASES